MVALIMQRCGMPRLSGSIADAGRHFFQICRQGWRIVGKVLLASIILSLFQALWGVPGWFIRNLPSVQQETPFGQGIQFLAFLFVLLIYLPVTFYFAASWAGFCPTIDDFHERKPKQ